MSANRLNQYNDRKGSLQGIQIDDLLLVLVPMEANGLLRQRNGLFKFTKQIGKNDYSIEINGKMDAYHANLLKWYIQRRNDWKVAASKAVIEPGDGNEAVADEDLVDSET